MRPRTIARSRPSGMARRWREPRGSRAFTSDPGGSGRCRITEQVSMTPLFRAPGRRRWLRLRRGPLSAPRRTDVRALLSLHAMPARDRRPVRAPRDDRVHPVPATRRRTGVRQVPTDSGGKHWVARCPTCRTAMWNSTDRQAITGYVRVGTLDEPDRFRRGRTSSAPRAWFDIPAGQPAFAAYYDAAKACRQPASRGYARAQELHQAQGRRRHRGTGTSRAAETGEQRSTAQGATKTRSRTLRSQ